MAIEWKPFKYKLKNGWLVECVECLRCGAYAPDIPEHRRKHEEWHERQG